MRVKGTQMNWPNL
nr:envelope glycoprotein [Human immunodeficiency virus 1]